MDFLSKRELYILIKRVWSLVLIGKKMKKTIITIQMIMLVSGISSAQGPDFSLGGDFVSMRLKIYRLQLLIIGGRVKMHIVFN